ncbi:MULTISPECIES: alpha/beta hydrolase [unclassified Kaistella]|uniref:alpha/beta hydrolase n=1 Tax=unclassified Kaistella TaxID=2762626 RepID=UPI0027353C80|nr:MULTISPECIES: alpha/beta hydrolase [unclassified Kaistella]MDP2452923.1 alpha/beta hydrolase [Kaistella sp. SH11-4b]MDP2455832.1 alpha/beta hydrolase [Kaistella sp. SH40-3]MDP2458736.1 alpha/beta hydrolase [Kaistella sp. SH19-2b]
MKKSILKYNLWTIGLFSIVLTSCSSKYRVKVGQNEKKIYNLKYGDARQQTMDVFIPESFDKEIPTVIIVHGGAWKMGRKEHMKMIQKFLHKNSIPTANINYRLVNKKSTYRQQLEDIGLAVEKINALAKEEGFKEDNYIILGESSGGHISMLYGYNNPQHIKKIISLSGPTDFYTENYTSSFYSKYSSPTIQEVVGEKFDRKNLSVEFKKASPIANVSNVPTLMFQGDRDILVNKKQGLVLDSVLTEKGIPHQLIFMKNTGHIPRFFSKKKRANIIFPNILEWVKS